jgi:hypothetical protein
MSLLASNNLREPLATAPVVLCARQVLPHALPWFSPAGVVARGVEPAH